MPILELLAGASALYGLFKGGQALLSNAEAKEIQAEARAVFQNAKAKLDAEREQTTDVLSSLGRVKIKVWRELGRFAEEYSRIRRYRAHQSTAGDALPALANVELQTMRELSLKASNVVPAAIGAGALTGIASYGGVALLGTASTGTAIATLSGAAAKNATLAWLGGGSLATGGAGMAGGMTVLGGLVLAPALAVGGLLMSSQAEKNLAEAKRNLSKAQHAATEMEKAIDALADIREVCSMSEEYIWRVLPKFSEEIDSLQSLVSAKRAGLPSWRFTVERWFGQWLGISKVKINTLTSTEIQIVTSAVKSADTIQTLVNTALLTADGAPNPHLLRLMRPHFGNSLWKSLRETEERAQELILKHREGVEKYKQMVDNGKQDSPQGRRLRSNNEKIEADLHDATRSYRRLALLANLKTPTA